MPIHPLWNPFDPPSEDEIRAARVHPAAAAPAPVEVVPPNSAWADWYTAVRTRVVDALGGRALPARGSRGAACCSATGS